MMTSNPRLTSSWMVLFVISLSVPAFGQEFLLRNNLVSGQLGQAVTQVDMQGDSILTGQKAATQLRMRMMRDFQVSSVDGMGNARVDVAVRQIQTQGKMDNTTFNKNLVGDELKQVMFGADHETLDITPLGMIKEGGDFSFEQLGISLPASVGDSGGFEFPTFPAGPVRVGSMWDEKGILIQPGAGRGTRAAGSEVYQLSRVTPTPQGRVAVIRYKKLTDLSGLGLGGNETLATQGAVPPALGTAQSAGTAAHPGTKNRQANGKVPTAGARNVTSKNQDEQLKQEISRLAEQAATAQGGAQGSAAQPGLRTVPTGTAPSGARSTSPSVKADGLVIQLEGEIEFNIDQGAVIKTTQHGTWNLNLNMNNLPSLQAGSSPAPKKALNMTQKMNMYLQTQFQWRKPPTAPSPAVQTSPALVTPPQLPVEKLPETITPPQELP